MENTINTYELATQMTDLLAPYEWEKDTFEEQRNAVLESLSDWEAVEAAADFYEERAEDLPADDLKTHMEVVKALRELAEYLDEQNTRVISRMALEFIRNEEAEKAVKGTEYTPEQLTDWQSTRDIEQDILRKRMTEGEAREAFREYFENLITDMRYYDESEKAE